MAWPHINFLGSFVFPKTPQPIDIKVIVEKSLEETEISKEAKSLAA